MRTAGRASLVWLMIRPLHDALIKDAFDCAEIALGSPVPKRKWSCWVRFLRWVMKRKK